jgi:sigma-B regulation protein RsbU (phosphoserine phosphatase)
MAQLQIQQADGRVVSHAINGTQWVMGRDTACEIFLDDTATSRKHARLYQDESGHYWIQDLKSKNGTTLNGRPVGTSRVEAGDKIGIGGCVLSLAETVEPTIVMSDTDTRVVGTNTWGRDEHLTLAERRLQSLYELNERLTGKFDRDDLLNEVLDICQESLRFERAGIAVWPGDPQPPQWVRIKDRTGRSGDIHISRSLVDHALHRGERILINDTSSGGFDPTASMISNNIRSAMCVPMEYHEKVRGVIYGDRVTTTGGYGREDIDFFAALGRLGAMGLANVQLLEEMRAREQVELQLRWAREIQSHLFPAEPLVLPGLTIDALNDPGQKVSGDYYDYLVRPDGLITIVVADVSGKGAPAALLMANLQAAVHVTMMEEKDLVQTVDVLNKLICRNVRETRFITGLFGLLDPAAKTFTYINAGHLGPYQIQADGKVRKIDPEPKLPLGIDYETQYVAESIDLSATPTTLLLYTDGVPDAENPQDEHFGEERLAELLSTNATQPPGELNIRIRRSIKQFARNYPQTDDITLLAIRLE